MSLTLVTGRANTGKTGVIHRELRSALAAGLPAVLLLPTMPDVRRTEAELGRVGAIGARVAVFDEWVGELWAMHGDGRGVAGEAVRLALLREALDSTRLEGLAASAASPGFLRLLGDILDRTSEVPQRRGGVSGEVAAILRRYHELAEGKGLIERGRAARLLAERPPALRGPVLVNRFTDLSECQELLLGALARHTDVSVALTWEPDLPATAALDPLIERMFVSADIVPLVASAPDSELERLEDRLYCPGEPLQAEGELQVGLAAGEEAECALAARAARALLDEGFAPERVAVVFRDAGRRLGLLDAALSAEGVRADLDVAVPLAATPFGAALIAALDAAATPRRERLLAFLLSPYSGVAASVVEAADVRWRRDRASGERMQREAKQMGPLAERALSAATAVAAKGMRASTASAWTGLADALLTAAVASRPRGSSEAELDGAAHRAVMRALDEIVQVSGASLDMGGVRQLVSQLTVAPGRAERDGAVQVTEAHRVRSRRFDAVVLGGLTADEFSAERPEPLAAEMARTLGAAPGLEERDAERMLFYLVLTRARHRLVLLRQDSDARGEPKRPSVFWDEVVDVYAGEDPAGEESPAAPRGVEPMRLGLAELALAAPAYAPGRRGQRAEVSPAGRANRVRGRLSDERVLAGLAAASEFSVTELETYLACPYRWFYDRAVRPRALDVEVDARERGSRAHRLLAAFYRSLEPRLRIRRVTPEHLPAALALLDEVAGEVETEARVQAADVREALTLAQAREWARAIVMDDADLLPGYEPLEHEFAFGLEAGRPCTIVGIPLRGSIDRIDAGPAGLVITDYKSERSPKGREGFERNGLIQVPLYALASASLLGAPVGAGLYRSLRSLDARGFRRDEVDLGGRGSGKDVVDDAALEETLAAAAQHARQAAEGIRGGVIAPKPRAGACAWCGARAFCGKAT